jgi:hypothetical protein
VAWRLRRVTVVMFGMSCESWTVVPWDKKTTGSRRDGVTPQVVLARSLTGSDGWCVVGRDVVKRRTRFLLHLRQFYQLRSRQSDQIGSRTSQLTALLQQSLRRTNRCTIRTASYYYSLLGGEDCPCPAISILSLFCYVHHHGSKYFVTSQSDTFSIPLLR